MATAPTPRFFSIDEYLEMEVRTEEKHEYFRGEIFLMSGGSSNHSLLKASITRLVGNHLLDSPCRNYDDDMRVKVNESGLYTYPDVSIACPPFEIENRKGAETLLNPVVIFEVLSPSTENYDRGLKFVQYQKVPSLREYVLVSQDVARVDIFARVEDGRWDLKIYQGLESTIRLETIDCAIRLTDIYKKVDFDSNASEMNDGPAS